MLASYRGAPKNNGDVTCVSILKAHNPNDVAIWLVLNKNFPNPWTGEPIGSTAVLTRGSFSVAVLSPLPWGLQEQATEVSLR